jgi:peptidoglycan/LPS O-acetylase OafA/YrhL
MEDESHRQSSRVDLQHQRKYDMLRGIASIAVLLGHVVGTYLERLLGSTSAIVLIASGIARHAVLMFFRLSGYLITQSIVANVGRKGRFDVSEYLSARIARIYPPFIGAILVVLLIWVIIHALDLPGRQRYGLPTDAYTIREAYTVDLKDVPRALLMQNALLQANGPLWSLYMEFHVYLIVMFIALATGRLWLLWGSVALALLVHWIRVDSSFAFFASVWALGAGAMLAKRKLIVSGAARRTKFLIYPLAALLLGAALFAPQLFTIRDQSPWVSYGVQLACCLVYADLMFLKDRFAANPPDVLVQTGNFSYSLYVIHFPMLLLILSLTQNFMGASLGRSLLVSIVATIAVLVAAAWFAKFFEDQRRFKPHIKRVLNAIVPGR